jgi:RES domain-containing protein
LVLARFEGDVSAETWIDFSNLADLKLTRGRGDAFLKNKVACVLRVPSVVLPEEMNLVFNPLHPDAGKIRLVSDRPFTFDGRLL